MRLRFKISLDINEPYLIEVEEEPEEPEETKNLTSAIGFMQRVEEEEEE